jgi:glycosyltransferase involved in cell wall biosynthesis
VKVLHVLGSLRRSGAEQMLRIAGPRWAELGVESSILVIDEHLGDFAAELEHVGFTIHHLPLHRSPSWVWRVRGLLGVLGPDVLHVHTEAAAFWTTMAARSTGAGVVRTVHTSFPFTARLRVVRAVQRQACRIARAHFVAVSPSVARNEWRRFRIRCEVIDNWVDVAALAAAPDRGDARDRLALGDDVAIVVVGNCGHVKNHDTLLDALARVGTDVPWTVLHAGSGDDEAAERRRAEAIGIGPRVRFLGAGADVPTLLAAADLFVMPSRYEGLGLAAVEALAAGVPCLLADVPGLADLRQVDGGSIHWVEPDVEGLTAGLRHVLTHLGDLLDRTGIAAERTRHRWEPDRGIASYLAAYARVARPSP